MGGLCLWPISVTTFRTRIVMNCTSHLLFSLPFPFHPGWFFIRVVCAKERGVRSDQPPSCFCCLSLSAPSHRPYLLIKPRLSAERGGCVGAIKPPSCRMRLFTASEKKSLIWNFVFLWEQRIRKTKGRPAAWTRRDNGAVGWAGGWWRREQNTERTVAAPGRTEEAAVAGH